MRWSTCAAFAALAVAAFCGNSSRDEVVHAGTAVRLELSEVADRADLALEGRVLSKSALLAPSGRIDTEYRIAVERTLVGEPLAVRTVRLPGGVLPDGRGLLLAGMPRLDVGEDVLVFLTRADASGARIPIGLAQGKFRVVRDPLGAKKLVRDGSGLELVGAGGDARHCDGTSVLEYTSALATIEGAIRARAERARSGR